jgi:hypothetical protein
MKAEVMPRLKGLGGKHITEVYLSEVENEGSIDNVSYESDPRININTAGTVSNQADVGTPNIPPVVDGDDVW